MSRAQDGISKVRVGKAHCRLGHRELTGDGALFVGIGGVGDGDRGEGYVNR